MTFEMGTEKGMITPTHTYLPPSVSTHTYLPTSLPDEEFVSNGQTFEIGREGDDYPYPYIPTYLPLYLCA